MKGSLLMSFPQLKTHKLVTKTLNIFLLSYANFTKKIHLRGSAVVLLPVQRAFLRRSVQLLTKHARGEEKKINACRHNIVRPLPNLHLADVNSYSNSYYMVYIFVINVWH